MGKVTTTGVIPGRNGIRHHFKSLHLPPVYVGHIWHHSSPEYLYDPLARRSLSQLVLTGQALIFILQSMYVHIQTQQFLSSWQQSLSTLPRAVTVTAFRSSHEAGGVRHWRCSAHGKHRMQCRHRGSDCRPVSPGGAGDVTAEGPLQTIADVHKAFVANPS